MPYDKIYALRGLNETIGVPDITISYDHSVQQAYAHFVKRWIKRYSNLDIITNYIESQNRVAPHLPSWVPDWSGKQICSRWDVGTSNTWGRSGGFSAWTVGPNREETPTTEQDERRFISTCHYNKFITLDGVTIDEIGGLELKSARSYKTGKDLLQALEPKDVEFGVYRTGESKISVFLQTLLSGRYRTDHLITAAEITQLVEDYQIYMGRKVHAPSSDKPYSQGIYFNSDWSLLDEKLYARNFAVTKSGYYCLVPEDSQVGDRLVALVGGNVPFVLRRVKHSANTATREEVSAPNSPSTEQETTSSPFSSFLTGLNEHPFSLNEDITYDEAEEETTLSLLSSTPTEPDEQSPVLDITCDETEVNGPAYSGTSRGPEYPLIYQQNLIMRETDDEACVTLGVEYFVPKKIPGSDSYDPSFKVIGTAYVHGVMNGEVMDAYRRGKAVMQTYLLV